MATNAIVLGGTQLLPNETGASGKPGKLRLKGFPSVPPSVSIVWLSVALLVAGLSVLKNPCIETRRGWGQCCKLQGSNTMPAHLGRLGTIHATGVQHMHLMSWHH